MDQNFDHQVNLHLLVFDVAQAKPRLGDAEPRLRILRPEERQAERASMIVVRRLLVVIHSRGSPNVAIDTRTNNVNTSKDKSRLILLHIITGGLITVHQWQIPSHTTPGFSARHITPLQWRPPGGTAVEEEGGLGGRPRGGGGAGAISAWPKCGFRRSMDTTSALLPESETSGI